jgi:hypothetical protein
MTNAELKTRFLVGYEFIANNLAPGYTDSEISGFLNQGMDLLVDELYSKNDIANIAELLVKENLTLIPASGNDIEDYGTSSYWTALVNNGLTDFRWLTNAKAKIKRTEPFEINYEWIECEMIEKRFAEKWVSTPINKPIIVYPKIVWHGFTDGFALICDSYSLASDLQIIYIKTPTRIDVTAGTCELNFRLHQKIVDKAIQLAMKATDAQRAEGEIKLNQAI